MTANTKSNVLLTFLGALMVAVMAIVGFGNRFLPKPGPDTQSTFAPFVAKSPVIDTATTLTQALVKVAAPAAPTGLKFITTGTNAVRTVEQLVQDHPVASVAVAAAATTALVATVRAFHEDHTDEEVKTKGAQAEQALASVAPTVPSPKVSNHLLIGFTIQGGVVANLDHATGFLGGVQWLKLGTTDDPRHLHWAFLTPVFFGSPNVKELGFLPVSWNIATAIPHQPLTNVWISPYVGGNPRHPSRVGIALTATF